MMHRSTKNTVVVVQNEPVSIAYSAVKLVGTIVVSASDTPPAAKCKFIYTTGTNGTRHKTKGPVD
eukprot:1204659-Amphidinium_carterae.1